MSNVKQQDWIRTSIRELESEGVIEFGRGKIISKKDIEAIRGDYPVYSSSAKGNGEFGCYGKFMFDEELVTWSVDGGGRFFYRPKSKYSITNVSGFLRVNAKDKLDTYYAWAHLFSLWETMTFNYTEKLHPSVLRERFSFSYPPLPEQKKIAHILSTVQRAIEAQERIIQTTTELFKSMLHQLMTAQIRVSNRDRIEGDFGEGWSMSAKLQQTGIGEFPSSWEVDHVDSAFDIQQGKQVSKRNRDGENQRPFLRTKNVFWNRLELTNLDQMHFTEAEQTRLELRANDLLVCEGGSIGRTALWNNEIERCFHQNHIHRLRVKNGKANPRFGVYWLWYAFDVAKLYYGRGNVTTIPNLSQSKLSELPMALPPLPEQKKIAHILSTIQQKTDNTQSKKSKLQDLFRTLLHELMTAKIRVHDIDFQREESTND